MGRTNIISKLNLEIDTYSTKNINMASKQLQHFITFLWLSVFTLQTIVVLIISWVCFSVDQDAVYFFETVLFGILSCISYISFIIYSLITSIYMDYIVKIIDISIDRKDN